jgi:gluconate kinase
MAHVMPMKFWVARIQLLAITMQARQKKTILACPSTHLVYVEDLAQQMPMVMAFVMMRTIAQTLRRVITATPQMLPAKRPHALVAPLYKLATTMLRPRSVRMLIVNSQQDVTHAVALQTEPER